MYSSGRGTLLGAHILPSSFNCLLPGKSQCHRGLDQDGLAGAKVLANVYEEVLGCNEQVFVSELKLWYRHLSHLDTVPRNAQDAFKLCNPGIRRALEVLAILP